MAHKTERTKYLIIGNSAGGIGAAEAIREVDKAGTIAIVSDEPYPAYSRPLISKYLSERCPIEKMLFRPADFYEKNDIRTTLGKQVGRLDIDAHSIKLADGSRIAWERLLLATGGLPIIPKMEGGDARGIFTFTTFDDAQAIDRFLSYFPDRTGRAVVIGGGLIGISVSEALVKRGVEVTVVEMQERILSTILDENASALAEGSLKQAGVRFLTGHTVSQVNSQAGDGVTGVTMDDGRQVPCELVIIAIGVRPRLELIAGTGIKVSRGILVDRHMATSCPEVYACGDVAEAYDFIYGENRLSPIWPNAHMGGRIAGFNMAGVPTDYQGGTAMNSLNYFGLAIVSAGMASPLDGGYEVLSRQKGDVYKKVILKDGRIMGMVFAGDIERVGIILSLMKDRLNVNGFKQELVADDFGLASLPEELWRPRLELPSSGPISPVFHIEQPEEAIAGE